MTMTSWVARVDWEPSDRLEDDLDAIDLIIEHLQGHSANLSRHPIDGVWEATVSIQAQTVDAAVTAVLDLVAGATGETPTGVEVLRESVFDGRVRYIQPMVKAQV